MRRFLLTFLLISTIAPNILPQTSEVWMIGPMVHFNIGNKKMHPSIGIELSYWNYNHIPYSFNGAIEFERNKIRLYCEGQTGIGIAGISLGPVLEIRRDESTVLLGLQRSIWVNYFAGIDLRFRSIGGTTYFCPGVYAKMPIGLGTDSDNDYHHDWD